MMKSIILIYKQEKGKCCMFKDIVSSQMQFALKLQVMTYAKSEGTYLQNCNTLITMWNIVGFSRSHIEQNLKFSRTRNKSLK